MNPQLDTLPIDATLPAIVAALESSRSLVVCAPPGTGKTTRVPRALYLAGFAEAGEILILEPRRLAARLAAARVAAEFGESPGETVGFSIRFENVGGPHTRIRFLTEGILARRIVPDPCYPASPPSSSMNSTSVTSPPTSPSLSCAACKASSVRN